MSHLLVNWQGNSPDGEVWSTGLRFAKSNSFSPIPGVPPLMEASSAQLQAVADGIAALNTGKGFPTRSLADISQALSIATIRVSEVTEAGTLVSAAEHIFSTPVAGTGQQIRPLQVAVVLTLNQGAQYGRHYRGRMFLPAIAGPDITGGGRVTAVNRQLRLDEWATFINDVAQVCSQNVPEGIPDMVFHGAVWSRTTGKVARLDNISMGDVLDTQRRRRDRLREARTLVQMNLGGGN